MIAEGEQGSVIVDAGSERWEITPQAASEGLRRAHFPQAASPESITLEAGAGRWHVLGMALVDERDGTFRSLVPGKYRRIHSGDVKIYENLDVLPRAFQVQQWRWEPDVSSSVAQMSSAGFDPRNEAIVAGEGEPGRSVAQPQTRTEISGYSSDEIVVDTASAGEGLLVVTDAYYPGWEATLDGEAVRVYQVNGYFRGVFVPAGSHRVRFEFRPRSYLIGRWISLGTLLLWVSLSLLLVATHGRRGKIESQMPLEEEKGLPQDRVRH
jgi:hypothetical protein